MTGARRWSESENAFLKNNYQTMSDVAIGEALGRRPDSVGHRRKIMKLERSKVGKIKQVQTFKKAPNDLDIEFVKSNYTMSNRELGERLKLTNKAIGRIKKKCNLPNFIKVRVMQGQMKKDEKKLEADSIIESIQRLKKKLAELSAENNDKKSKRKNQENLKEEIEIIREGTLYLIGNMKDVSPQTFKVCEENMNDLIKNQDDEWWWRRIDWKLGQFIELVLPGYEFVPVVW